MYWQKVKADEGYVECPQDGCDWCGAPYDAADEFDFATREVRCAKCGFVFCASCRREHHYATPCDQVMSYARQWREWLDR